MRSEDCGYRRLKIVLVYCLLLVTLYPCCGDSIFRALTGSNCVQIERGKTPIYYKCLGCVTEEAMGCIDDLRFNRTGNVPSNCDFARITEYYEGAKCCPQFGTDNTGRLNLLYMGSAYPETLECLINVGCEGSVVYQQLLEECNGICSPLGEDPRGADGANFGEPGAVCTALYNGAPRGPRQIPLVTFIVSIGLSVILALFHV